jgi:hypothetical protein
MFRRLLLFCLLTATIPAQAGWFSSGVKVRRISPQGAQSVHPGSLQIEFNEEVKGVGNVAAGFSFEPAVKGYAYVSGHQLNFNPNEGFAPATDYKFTFKTERVRATGKEMADKEITGSFSTPNLSLIDKRGFFSVDEASGSEKELIIELVFNYPVAPEAVTKVLKLENRGKQLGYHAERGGSPERLYLKLDKLLEAQQAIVLTQTGTLLCQRCGKGDATLLKGMLTTPDRVDLEVKEFNLQADPSSTRATFLFSLPVSAAGRRDRSREPADRRSRRRRDRSRLQLRLQGRPRDGRSASSCRRNATGPRRCQTRDRRARPR